MEVTIRLTEAEAGALDALAGYSVDEFLKVFYEKMGRAYLEPYEAGLRTLFDSVRSGSASVRSLLERAQQARQVFTGERIAVYPKPKQEGV